MSLRTGFALIAVVLSVSATAVRAQPCSDTLVPSYGAGTLTGTINCGTVFDDQSGTGPALFIGGGGGGSLLVHQLAGTLVKLVNGHWVTNTTLGGSVTCLTVLDDGSGSALFIGGDFTIAPSTVHVNVAKWDGTTWTAFPTLNSSGGIPVSSMIIHDDGNGAALYVGGAFGGVSIASRGMAKWTGQAWTAVGTGVTSTGTVQVRTLKSFNDGTGNKLYVGGNIATAGGVPVTGLASWDGTAWAAVGPGFGSGRYNSDVYSLAVYDDGGGTGLYAAGVINLPDRHNGNSPVALWRGGSWSRVLGIGEGINSNQGASALISLDDGIGQALYAAAGPFVEGANQVWRLRGGSWATVGPALSSTAPGAPFGATVNTFIAMPQPEGTRLVSLGNSTNSGMAIAPPASKWSEGTWRPVESGAHGLSTNPRLFSDEQARDGRLYASGFLLTDSGWSAQPGPDPVPTSPYIHLDRERCSGHTNGQCSGCLD